MKEIDKKDVLLAVQEYIRKNVNSEDIDGLMQAIEKAMQANYILESERIDMLEYLQRNVGVKLVESSKQTYGMLTIWDKGGSCYSLVGQAIYELKKKYTYMQHKASVGGSCGDGVAVADSDAPTSKQQATSKQPQQKKRGRQIKPFADCITIPDKQGLLELLHKTLDGKKGKAVYLVINVLISNGVIMPSPTYSQLKREFGDIGSDSAKSEYKGLQPFLNEEIEGVKSIFAAFLK